MVAILEDAFRDRWGTVLATLVGLLGDVDLAEEAAQEAFALAAERWPRDGIPEHPKAWLVATGRNRAIVAEELGGTAEVIYFVDLAPADRAHALGRAGAVLSHDTSKELRPEEILLIRNARLLQFTAAGVDLDALAAKLQSDAAKGFVDSWTDLMAHIDEQSAALSA